LKKAKGFSNQSPKFELITLCIPMFHELVENIYANEHE